MGHRHDYWEWLRKKFAPLFGWIVGGICYDMQGEKQFVAMVRMDVEEFEEILHGLGFTRNPLSYFKKVSGLGGESGSWRLTKGDYQLHTTVYRKGDLTYVYAHWELRWDRYPLKHLRGVGLDSKRGVRKMREMLKRNGPAGRFKLNNEEGE